MLAAMAGVAVDARLPDGAAAPPAPLIGRACRKGPGLTVRQVTPDDSGDRAHGGPRAWRRERCQSGRPVAGRLDRCRWCRL